MGKGRFPEEQMVGILRDVLDEQALMMGEYFYGEISPSGDIGCCKLHNQTMSSTVFSED